MRKISFGNIFGNIPSVLFVIVVPAMFFMTSCTKNTSQASDNAKFIGTWIGSEVCYYSNNNDTETIEPVQENIGVGNDGSSINIGLALGANACYRATYLVATVKNYSFSFPAMAFLDNCGNSYTTGGTGSVNTAGTTLTMTSYLQTNTTTTCTFIGTKQ